ncbi:DUF2726 domain-containing protein [Slackia heliotrinireducens]|uniref:DUF2726 domain-containing protein n=1 Tax=Slackia heliotrinireducens TaxID=84110 RepID=UPI0033152096
MYAGTMCIFIGQTAMDYYRAHRYGGLGQPLFACDARQAVASSNAHSNIQDVLSVDLRKYDILWPPEVPTILVTDKNAIRPTDKVNYRLYSGQITAGMVVRIDKDVYLPSVEFHFLLSADNLPLAQLIELGFELCGNYDLGPYNDPFALRPEQLTTPSKLKCFLEGHKGVKGCKKALQAVSCIASGSWSPMESKLATAMSLRSRCGGYEYGIPRCNHEIKLSNAETPLDGRRSFYIDLLFIHKDCHSKLHRGAIEYDGLMHQSEQAQAKDRAKTHVLEARGIDVMHLAFEDINTFNKFDHQMQTFGRMIKVKRKPASLEVIMARQQVYDTLFSQKGMANPGGYQISEVDEVG